MHSPAFILHVALSPARAVLPPSSLRGRPISTAFSVRSSLRVPHLLRACASIDPASNANASPPLDPDHKVATELGAPISQAVEAEQPSAPASGEPVAEQTSAPASGEPVPEQTPVPASGEPVAEQTPVPASGEPVAEQPPAPASGEPVAEPVAPEVTVAEAVPEQSTPSDPEQTSPAKSAPLPGQEEATATDPAVTLEPRRRRRTRVREPVTLPLNEMQVGMELEGVVKNVMEYGAFVGGMGTSSDGLLHVSQLGDSYVEKVKDVVNVGDKIKVRVLAIDLVKANFSLTMKSPEQMQNSSAGGRPAEKDSGASRNALLSKKWDDFKYDEQEFIDAKVMSVTDFGGFCRLIGEDGQSSAAPTDGLIHISELREEHVAKVSDVLKIGDVVKARVTSTDRKRNRISLSMIAFGQSAKKGRDRDRDREGSVTPEELAAAQESQPVFKTSLQLAFEKAQTTLSDT